MPPFVRNHSKPGNQDVFSYFDVLFSTLWIDPTSEEDKISLPPLEALGRFFNCSMMEVHQAFCLLRKSGYDYELVDLDHPILFWKQSK